jgi:hypothetical protein
VAGATRWKDQVRRTPLPLQTGKVIVLASRHKAIKINSIILIWVAARLLILVIRSHSAPGMPDASPRDAWKVACLLIQRRYWHWGQFLQRSRKRNRRRCHASTVRPPPWVLHVWLSLGILWLKIKVSANQYEKSRRGCALPSESLPFG